MGLRNRIRRFLWDRKRRRSRRSGVAHYEINGRRVTLAHRRTDVDMAVLEQCFDAGQYEIPEGAPRYRSCAEAFYDRILASGGSPLIVDCGANIGASVAWFAARYPRAHIVAVEPAADNIELLRRNCRAYDVDLRAAAVGPYRRRDVPLRSGGGHLGLPDGRCSRRGIPGSGRLDRHDPGREAGAALCPLRSQARYRRCGENPVRRRRRHRPFPRGHR